MQIKLLSGCGLSHGSDLALFVLAVLPCLRACGVAGFVTHEPLHLKTPDKIIDVQRHLVGDPLRLGTKFSGDVVHAVPAVEQIPDENTRRVEAEGLSRIRIQEDCPAIEPRTENHQGVGQCIALFHGCFLFPNGGLPSTCATTQR